MLPAAEAAGYIYEARPAPGWATPMPKPYLHLHVHFVWSTWDRAPALTADLAAQVDAAIADKARKLGCHRVDVGGVADHVHVLVSLPATLAVADLVGQLKGVSSH